MTLALPRGRVVRAWARGGSSAGAAHTAGAAAAVPTSAVVVAPPAARGLGAASLAAASAWRHQRTPLVRAEVAWRVRSATVAPPPATGVASLQPFSSAGRGNSGGGATVTATVASPITVFAGG